MGGEGWMGNLEGRERFLGVEVRGLDWVESGPSECVVIWRMAVLNESPVTWQEKKNRL